ncbi:LysR substrate-binding domain-containing protein [Caballeronia sp. LjRoot29]|uniref:LysR substrate-binding domain-containing protein n=1 Tax=Caballeronia sp. LjRoot29 TaxID=3342315 RepID=UPI003ECC5F27
MDLRHLRYFVAVAEEKHFGRAAQRLHIVQPALSMQIRALEEDMGGPLFVRTSRRVELTEAGALLLIEARRTLAQAEHAKSVVQRSLRGEIGSVKVGFAGNAVLTGKLADNLRVFHRGYPEAQLQIIEMAPHLQGEAILAGHLDVGYSPSLDSISDPRLVTEKIGTWPFMVAMTADHPLAKKKRVSIKSLATETLILYAVGDDAFPLLQQHVIKATNVVHRVSSTLSVLALAAAGLGVALVPAPLDRVTIPNLVYRPIAETDMSADLLLFSRANETSGAVLAFLGLARGTSQG